MAWYDCPGGRRFDIGVDEHCPDCGRGWFEDYETDEQVVADGGRYVTAHAAERWDERTSPDSVAPETAWQSSERRVDLTRDTGLDEVRLHRSTDLLLGRRGVAIVTALPMDDYVDDLGRVA